MPDEKTVTITLELAKAIADDYERGNSTWTNLGHLRNAIAAQHPPEPQIPDSDWACGERDGMTWVCCRNGDLWDAMASGSLLKYCWTHDEVRRLRDLRPLRIPVPGETVREGWAHANATGVTVFCPQERGSGPHSAARHAVLVLLPEETR